MVVTRHQFLRLLHRTLKPRGYLEIGVHSGDSLLLVEPGTPAIGIDPAPRLRRHLPGTVMVKQRTSDQFFEDFNPLVDGDLEGDQVALDWLPYLDLAFIDGMHLYEYAVRDFVNVEKLSNPHTVVVFDDVLPRNQEEAAREQCPGDWTGDVWKVFPLLELSRPDLGLALVDTAPTGTLVVWNLDPRDEKLLREFRESLRVGISEWELVPEYVLQREYAMTPEAALALVSAYLLTVQAEEENLR